MAGFVKFLDKLPPEAITVKDLSPEELERQPGETDLELKKRIAFLKQAERRAGNR